MSPFILQFYWKEGEPTGERKIRILADIGRLAAAGGVGQRWSDRRTNISEHGHRPFHVI